MAIPLKFASLYDGQEVLVWPDCLLDLGTDFLFSTWSLYEMRSILREHLISMACILLWSSAVRVHDSQAYRNLDKGAHQSYLGVERNSLVNPNWFQPVYAAVVCAILQSISGSEPSSVVTEPRYF